jgi:septum formation inhibitor-activating ATPase MinD
MTPIFVLTNHKGDVGKSTSSTNIAVTIRDDGQVNLLTVVDVSEGVVRQFRIETGELSFVSISGIIKGT